MGDPKEEKTAAGEEDFAALFAASETEPVQRPVMGQTVRGRVIAIGATSAFIEIGGKGEAIIDAGELRDPQTGEPMVAVGDQIDATVVDDGGTSGTVVLKRTVGRGGHVPGELEQAHAHGLAVEGLVSGENKGGFDVQIGSVRAFCPFSQMDRRRAEPATYIGQRLRFKVTKIDAGGRNIVVSRRALLDDEAAEQAASTWERIEVGAVLQGRVTSIRDFGAFVDLGGVEGLIHVSELGHGRVSHPSKVLEPEQIVEVKVVKVEPGAEGGRGRVGLSLRALEPDPWQSVRQRFSVGTSVRGVVRRLEPFGAFVEIAPGIDGLVHVSKLALDRRVSHPRQVVNPGDEVDVTVVAIDEAQRRISLSMVETAKREREAEETRSRSEEDSALGRLNEQRSLGTLADLLAASKRGGTK
jgi:small subunit ribosomal protein S1